MPKKHWVMHLRWIIQILEVIAINDGSSDNTAAVLNRLADRYEKLRVVHLAQNQAQSHGTAGGKLAHRC